MKVTEGSAEQKTKEMDIEKQKSGCLSTMMGVFIWFLLFLTFETLSYALHAGPVAITGEGRVDLAGTPGEEITLDIRPHRGEVRSSLEGVRVRLQNSEYELETVVTIVEPGAHVNGNGRILGSFIVPEAPGGASVVLSGTLWGDVLRPGGHENLEIPVTLRVMPRGEGITTAKMGKRESQLSWMIFFVFLGLTLGLTVLAVLLAEKEECKTKQTAAVENK